jgi:hypothetical protein
MLLVLMKLETVTITSQIRNTSSLRCKNNIRGNKMLREPDLPKIDKNYWPHK